MFLNGYNPSIGRERRWIVDCKPVQSQLFSGYTFYFGGFLGEKTRLQLVELVRVHGGEVERFYSSSLVNVYIADNLCHSKVEHFRDVSIPFSYSIETKRPCSEGPVYSRFRGKEQTTVMLSVQHHASIRCLYRQVCFPLVVWSVYWRRTHSNYDSVQKLPFVIFAHG